MSIEQHRVAGDSVSLPDPAHIPADLRHFAQWVAWGRGESRDKPGTPSKVPIDPKTGKNASPTDEGTWGTLDQALQTARRHDLAGIGYVFSADDPFAGVDLDHCRDPDTGEIADWAQEIIDNLDSYTEVSPSGTGIHILVRGALPPEGRRKGSIELYDQARYFTFTGQHVDGTPTSIEDRQRALDALHARVFDEPISDPGAESPDEEHKLTDDEVIEKALAAKNGERFRQLWEGDHSAYVSQSEGELALCGTLAFFTNGNEEQIDRLFRRSGLMRDKWDQLRGHTTYGQRTIAKALSGRTDYYSPRLDDSDAEGGGGGQDDNQATLLVRIVQRSEAELFHTPAGEPYATIRVGKHRETHRIGSRAFNRWLGHLAFKKLKKAVQASVLHDTRMTLEGRAIFDGPEEQVHVRVAEHQGFIYLDLGGPDWEAVKIGPQGWELRARPPVRFRRPGGVEALPRPRRGGNISRLRRFVNVTDSDWPLILGWEVAAVRPRGPYPILGLTGEHGAAKSTTGRSLRRLVDPNTAPLRAQPRETRDLMIAASNGHVLAYDNLSSLSPALSDALCMIATGGGFATRALYTDDDEMIFDVQRPILSTSIDDILGRADLMDRTILCNTPKIAEGDRRDEQEIWREFEAEWPYLLGALLDAVVVGLRNMPSVRLNSMPRMADFARWATACEPGLGLRPGTFLRAYEGNREAAIEIAIDSDLVAQALIALVNSEPNPIETTATGLLDRLNATRGQEKPPKGWPGTPKGMGSAIRRLAPGLRAIGIAISFSRVSHTRRRLVRLARDESGPGTTGPTGPTVPPAPGSAAEGDDLVDRVVQSPGRNVPPSVPSTGPANSDSEAAGPVGTMGTHFPGPSAGGTSRAPRQSADDDMQVGDICGAATDHGAAS